MSRTMQYAAFYTVFFAVLWAMHLYVGLRLARLFDYHHAPATIGLCTLLALAFPVCSLMEKFNPNTFSMVLYSAASIWLGAVFLLMSVLLVYELVRFVIPLPPRIAGAAVCLIAGSLAAYGLVNALFIGVKPLRIDMPGLAAPLSIVQLSDIHVGTIHNSGFLKRIVDKTNALEPDLVLITGDLFDGIGPVTGHTVAPLAGLKAKTFFVIGNHERYDDMDKIERVLSGTGVEMLQNRVVDFRGVQIIGIDAPMRDGEKSNPVIGRLPLDRARPSILLYHIPVGIPEAVAAGVKLQLSGHTHNGQLFPFTLLARWFYPYAHGLYSVDGMQLYVSPGTGTWGPPMRIGSVNEITHITLVPRP